MVKLLHERDPTSILKLTPGNQDPLHLACLHGHAPVALYLIDKGLGTKDIRDDGGFTAIVYAGRWARRGLGDAAMLAVEEKLKSIRK